MSLSVCVFDGSCQVLRPNGTFLKSFGEEVLQGPRDVASLPGSGQLMVTSLTNHSVLVFGPDGKFQRKFGEAYLANPYGIAVFDGDIDVPSSPSRSAEGAGAFVKRKWTSCSGLRGGHVIVTVSVRRVVLLLQLERVWCTCTLRIAGPSACWCSVRPARLSGT